MKNRFNNPAVLKMSQTCPNRSRTSKLMIRNTFWTPIRDIRIVLKKDAQHPLIKKIHKCPQKTVFFYMFCIPKRWKNTFLGCNFSKITISHELERTYALGNFESMSKWFLTSNGLVIHLLFTSGGKKNHFFGAANASWNNYFQVF